MSDRIIETAQKHLRNIPLTVVSQGAEAVIFQTQTHPYLPSDYKSSTLDSNTYIIKYRPPKPYRHPKLDQNITKSRTISEAKLLNKLFQLGINVPRLISCDSANGIIWMEAIGDLLDDGSGEEKPISSLKNWLWMLEKQGKDLIDEAQKVMFAVGKEVALLHLADIIHGDLTSSNIMLTQQQQQPSLIDFGLSSYSNLSEDKAVDLYVLERALLSTHPVHASSYNKWLLEGYEDCHKANKLSKKHTDTIRRLRDVRMRGRKRSMLG